MEVPAATFQLILLESLECAEVSVSILHTGPREARGLQKREDLWLLFQPLGSKCRSAASDVFGFLESRLKVAKDLAPTRCMRCILAKISREILGSSPVLLRLARVISLSFFGFVQIGGHPIAKLRTHGQAWSRPGCMATGPQFFAEH